MSDHMPERHIARFGFPFPPMAGGSEQAEGQQEATPDTPEGTGAEAQQSQEQREMIELGRYKQLQAEYTRTRQQMTDPEYQQQVAQEWLSANGYALPDDEPEPEYTDPSDALAQRLEQLEQQVASRTEQEQRTQQLQALEEYSERKLGELGLDEKDPARDWIVSRAIAMNPNADGQLDIEGAHRELQSLQTHLQQQWMQTKRAPRTPGSGQQATQTKALDDMSLQELQEWQAQRLADLDAG